MGEQGYVLPVTLAVTFPSRSRGRVAPSEMFVSPATELGPTKRKGLAMARRGDVIENPVTGERIVFLRTARDTAGALLQFEDRLAPHASSIGRVQHSHPRQEERITVLAGTVCYRIRRQTVRLDAGDTLVLPPGTPHAFWNDTDAEAHVVAELRPALRTETALETICGLCRDGKTSRRGVTAPLQAIAMLDAFADEVGVPALPRAAQRRLVAALAPLARWWGYRGWYPEYSGQG